MLDKSKELLLGVRNALEDFVGEYTAKGFSSKLTKESILIHSLERVLTSSFSSLSIPQHEDAIVASSSDSIYPKTIGFITILAKALSEGCATKVYVTKIGSEQVYSLTKPRLNENEYESFTIDACLMSNGIVNASIGLIIDAMKAINSGMDISKAIIIKLEGLIDEIDDSKAQAVIKAQMKSLDTSFRKGKTGVTSSGSSIESISYNIEPMQKAKEFGFQLLAFGLGYPVEFFDGIGGSSLSDTGASTEKAIHRGDTRIANMILIPFIKERFGITCKVKPLLSQLSDITVATSIVESSEVITFDDAKLIMSCVGLDGDDDKIKALLAEDKVKKSMNEIDEIDRESKPIDEQMR